MDNNKKRLLGFRLDPNNPYRITPQEVSEEVYFALGRPIWRHQKKMQALGRCCLPDLKLLWKCDGDCELCDFKRNGRTLPLNRERENANGDTYREGDLMPSDELTPEAIAVDRITLDKLLARLTELCPDALAVGSMMTDQDISQRKALELLEMNRTTYRSQFEKASRQVCREFGVESIDELF
ncbi:MAG: hypothetical protein IJ719_20270 [Clostridia bacterium]|nr:hypothetical protein [Clostridia bacterium]